jgi:predicted nucleic acid-binding protein
MNDEYVVDTDIVSYLLREDSRVDAYRPYLAASQLSVSFMTIAELDQWALTRGWGGRRRQQLLDHLDLFTTILVDRQMCHLWASVMVQARSSGRPIQVADAWVAATALRLGVPLITNNHGDYAGVTDLTLIRPSNQG